MRDSESEASYGVGEGNITMLKYLELENFKSYRGVYERFGAPSQAGVSFRIREHHFLR